MLSQLNCDHFRTTCQKSGQAEVYNSQKWGLFIRALETNLYNCKYITISERQQSLQFILLLFNDPVNEVFGIFELFIGL